MWDKDSLGLPLVVNKLPTISCSHVVTMKETERSQWSVLRGTSRTFQDSIGTGVGLLSFEKEDQMGPEREPGGKENYSASGESAVASEQKAQGVWQKQRGFCMPVQYKE